MTQYTNTDKKNRNRFQCLSKARISLKSINEARQWTFLRRPETIHFFSLKFCIPRWNPLQASDFFYLAGCRFTGRSSERLFQPVRQIHFFRCLHYSIVAPHAQYETRRTAASIDFSVLFIFYILPGQVIYFDKRKRFFSYFYSRLCNAQFAHRLHRWLVDCAVWHGYFFVYFPFFSIVREKTHFITLSSVPLPLVNTSPYELCFNECV